MFLFFSVARSQEIGSWERAAETTPAAADTKPKVISKASASAAFGTNMPLMSSAFDTAMWLKAA